MPYNTISLIDINGQERIFEIMTITLKDHLEEVVKIGCELCKRYGALGFQINYCSAGYPWGTSVYYDTNGNKTGVEIWND